jgi:hypothetical protein
MTLPCPQDLVGPYVYDFSVRVLWVENIVDAQNPTEDEILTGVDLTETYDLSDLVGWELQTEIIRDGIWGPFEEQRLGRESVQDAQIFFPAYRDGSDIRVLLQRGMEGFIVILPSGPYEDYPLAPVHVYPVIVAEIAQRHEIRSGGASMLLVTFAIRARCGGSVLVVPSS